MSISICPNASRSLLRLAGRSFPSRTTHAASIAPWLCGASQRGTPLAWQTSRSLSSNSAPAFAPRPSPRYGDRRTLFSSKIVKNYEELPADYRDQKGLKYRGWELTDAEATQLFGPGLGAVAANHLLRILHGRRVAGTLADPAFAVHTAQFSPEQKEKALEFLRRTVPVEEVLNAGLRAEDELIAMEEASEKKEKASSGKPEEEEVDVKEDPIYGVSTFDKIRAKNVAKYKAEEKALEEERKAAEERGEVVTGPLATTTREERQIVNPRIAEYYEKAQSDLDAPPEMSASSRILPSATLVILVLGFLTAVASVYEEPAPRFRLIREWSTSQATCAALIAANVLVMFAWKLPPMWKVMNRYMVIVVATVRPVTMFTAVFSHQTLAHLSVNALALWFVGTNLHDEIGRGDFLTLYAACGSLGFLGSLATYTLRGMLTITTLGASGAVLGITSAWFWEHRNDGFRFFGMPQNGVHGIVILALLAALQMTAWGRTVKLKVDLASHAVGMITGVAGMEMINHLRGRHKGERTKAMYNMI